MNKKLFLIEIEYAKKTRINKLILSAVFCTLIIILCLANIPGCRDNIVRGLLFMTVVVTVASYLYVIYSLVNSYTDKFMELSEKYKW